MEQPSKLTREQIIEQEMDAVYEFFVQAERSGEHFPYKKICEMYPHDISTVRKYVRNYWSWFLVKVDGTRPFAFACRGLDGYPKPYFIAAHMPNQGQYFYHFARAMQEAADRAEERRRQRLAAKALADQLPLPAISQEQEAVIAQAEAAEAQVPEQTLPEQMHFVEIDDEIEEKSEHNGTGPHITAAVAPVTLSDEPPFSLPLYKGAGIEDEINHQPDPDVPVNVIKDEPQPVGTSQQAQPEPPEPEPSPVDSNSAPRPTGSRAVSFVVAAVCVAVVVGLTIWWVVSRK